METKPDTEPQPSLACGLFSFGVLSPDGAFGQSPSLRSSPIPRPLQRIPFLLLAAWLTLAPEVALAESAPAGRSSLLDWILPQQFNTRVVLLGTLLLGMSAGVVGVFMLLRRRSLVGDVVGHSALPGIALAFLVLEIRSPGTGRSFPALLTGAFLSGMIGVGCVTFIRRWTRIKEDAALAIVLSLFFGIGIALFTVIQNLPRGNAAGLGQFIFGTAAALVPADVLLIAIAAALSLALCGLMFKEFALLCFDEDFARSQGWPTVALDLLLMALVAAVTVIGLQSVGLLLVVARLIVPAVSARFWTNRVSRLILIAGIIGGVSSVFGVILSGAIPRLAAGPCIVLTGSAVFLASLLFGPQGGVVERWWRDRQLRLRTARHDLLRAIYEIVEARAESLGRIVEDSGSISNRPTPAALAALHLAEVSVSEADLNAARTWPASGVRKVLDRAQRERIVVRDAAGWRLTTEGAAEATRVVRNHRLWEQYLVAHADIAPSHVDRDADLIEHVLEPDVIAELERLLAQRPDDHDVPPSLHALPGS
ncbi:MAG: metal ABC transporter permease [Planctomycetaceae bacterium]|nr:metal ABC transporter permease [Planctomycetaceae bacterium]